MPSEYDEVSRELQRRRQERARRQAQREREAKERRALMIRLGAVGVVLVAVTGLIVWFALGAGEVTPTEPGQSLGLAQTQPAPSTPPDTQPGDTTPDTIPAGSSAPGSAKEEYTTITIAAAGDLNVTDQMVLGARTPLGYDFTEAFVDVTSTLSGADLALLNYEGTFGGTLYGSETGAAPPQLAQTMAAMGVDAVQTANSASIRNGILGLQSTIQTLRNAGIEPIGTFADPDAFRASGGYTVLQVKGLRIALVGFTKGMDNLGLPEGSGDCVNLLYEDYTTDYEKIDRAGIRSVLRRVREEQADLTIAMVHWGSEYNEDISSSQKSIRNLMLEEGVDVILGSHSHLLKTIEHDTENNTLVAYSLGDFYGDAPQPGSNYSIVLQIQVTRDNVTGQTTIDGFTYTPIYTVMPDESAAGGQRVVRIREALVRYENNYLGKVTKSVYDGMTYSLKRIDQRIVEEIG